MEMKKYIITVIIPIIFLISLMFLNTAFSEPAMETYALNHISKEYSIFWPGDEFKQYRLPEGWETLNLLFQITIETPHGICNLNAYDDYSECCNQLNLTAVDPSKVSIVNDDIFLDPSIYFDEEIKGPYKCKTSFNKQVEEGDGIFINIQTQECTASINSLYQFSLVYTYEPGSTSSISPRNNECYITDDNWIRYYKGSNVAILETPHGECPLPIKSSSGLQAPNPIIENCLKELGYTYKNETVAKGKLTSLGFGEKFKFIVDHYLFSPVGVIILVIVFILLFLLIKKRK